MNMFTIEQIRHAHSKVRSGADFPAYIREIKALGVRSYETFIADGRTDFSGDDPYKVSWPAKYEPLNVADHPDVSSFKTELRAHQQGESDYLSFCSLCAKLGIAGWVVRMDKMSCTYYDKDGREVLVEQIPG